MGRGKILPNKPHHRHQDEDHMQINRDWKQSRSSESLKHHCSVEGNVSTKRIPRGERQWQDTADVSGRQNKRNALIKRQLKARPGRTQAVTKLSFPNNCCNSRLEKCVLFSHEERISWSSSSRKSGTVNVVFKVLTQTPKQVISSVGGVSLSGDDCYPSSDSVVTKRRNDLQPPKTT